METHLPHSPGNGLLARSVAWASIFIAVTSLGITLYEARATREHDRMAVWPRLSQESSDSAGVYDRTITNVGLGPALVKNFEVRLDDTVRTSWTRIVSGLLASSQPASFFFSTVHPGTVLLPGHSIQVVTIVGKELSGVAISQDQRVVSKVCYCSLYDECWTASSNHAEPAATSGCNPADTTVIGR